MTSIHPPKLATILLRLTVPRWLRDSVLGDLEEEWRQRRPSGRARAAIWYGQQAAAMAAQFLREGLRPEPVADSNHRAVRPSNAPSPVHQHTTNGKGAQIMQSLGHDLRYGWRTLRKNPGFAAVAILTLALGIGANTAIFSVAYAVMLRPLPYSEPDRLTTVWGSFASTGLERVGLTQAEYVAFRQSIGSFDGISAYTRRVFMREGHGEPELLTGALVSHNLFTVLGVQPAIGRTFTAEEELAGQDAVVVLSHRYWQRQFGGARNVLGRSLTLNQQPVTVIGVMPPEFRSPRDLGSERQDEAWMPLGLNLASLNRGTHGLLAVARYRPGATVEQATAEISMAIARVREEAPSFYPPEMNFHIYQMALAEALVTDVRRGLLVLLGAVGFVLLIACANVANLQLARADARYKEMAIRTTLGAGRGHVVRQLLVENVPLALCGGLGGVALAWWSLRALLAITPTDIPRAQDIGVSAPVLLFTLAVSLVTGVLFGLAPAAEALKAHPHEALKQGGRGSSGSRGALRRVLVVAEVSLALVLLISAGLLMRSFWRLTQADVGISPAGLLTLRVLPPASSYAQAPQVFDYYQRVFERVRALPGVEGVAATNTSLFSGAANDTMFQIENRPFEVNTAKRSTDYHIVTPSYAEVTGARLLRGRFFTEADGESSARVAVINETMARQHWPDEDPIGQRVRLLDAPPPQATTPYMTIVGVVADLKNRGARAEQRQEMYVPHAQQAGSLNQLSRFSRWMTLLVRTPGDPDAFADTLRREVAAVDSQVLLTQLRTMEQIVSGLVLEPRFHLILLGSFAGLALVLSAVGIYGVISYAVSRRTQEIGVRVALGAGRGDILRLVVGQGALLAAWGVVIGLVGAFAMTRVLASLLFGVAPTDPATFAAVAVLLTAVALLACYIPARRATRVDPVVALRYE